jgi:hypothetical protein
MRDVPGRVKDALLTRRAALIGGALACFGVAALLFLLAADVARWRDALPADDVRYLASPEATDLWQPDTRLPAGLSSGALGVEEDADLRRALRSFRLARLESPVVSDPQQALDRNEAQARLEAIVGGTMDRKTRSRAAALLGAIGIARLGSESQERAALLEATVANLRLALELDPGNAEAKFNLELALQRGRGIQPSEAAGGANPSPGGAGSSGAGAGDPGSGY